MIHSRERRALQLIVAIACLVPLAVGGAGVIAGPAWLKGVSATAVPIDLDSHFRYISGIFMGIGFAFATCVPRIEHKGGRFRLLAAFVICGGCARLISLILMGTPSSGHLLGLAMELGVVPILILWQARIERLCRNDLTQMAG